MSELPLGWTQTTIGTLCDLVNGKAFKPSDWSDTGLRIVRIQNLNRPDAKFNHYAGHVEERFLVEEGDLLFAWSGTPGTSFGAHIWDGPKAVLNQHIFNVRFDAETLDRAFFRYAINQTLDEQIAKAHGGVGLRHVTKGKFEETAIALPPLPEQRRIVAKIDSLTGKSRRARDHLDHIPRLVEKYKQAVLAAAFTGHLTPEIDASWFHHIPLAKVTSSTFYGPRIAKEAYVAAGVPTLRTTDIADWGRLVPKEPPQVEVNNADFVKWRFEHGDLMVTRTGATIGKCAVYEAAMGPALPSAYLIRVRLKQEEVDPRFAVLFLLSPVGQRQLLDGRTAVAQPNINAAAITSVRLPLPPVRCQRSIVQKVDALFTWIDRLAADATSARKLIDHLDHAVLAKAFRGELGPQDPDDEPASALLERIRAERGTAPQAKRGRKT